MILTDKQIRELVRIEPWAEFVNEPGVISYGLSSMGYDVRLGTRFAEFVPNLQGYLKVIDPKQCRIDSVERCEPFLLPSRDTVLGETLEHVWMPDDVSALCVGKSTWARCGLMLNTTPIEPGWNGKITLEITNLTSDCIRLYPGEGIGQLVFFRSTERPEKTYGDKKGKYQSQAGVTGPIVR